MLESCGFVCYVRSFFPYVRGRVDHHAGGAYLQSIRIERLQPSLR